MGPRAARSTHLGLILLGAVLYFLFVIPRWWVLTGDIPVTLGTVGRIAAGVPIAAAAVPVMLTLQRSLKPEAATPELALRLRAWSAVLHVVAGVLMVATAVAEIWLNLDSAGPWLFAVYGAAGATAALGVLAFVLSFRAEKPPSPPKPAKVKAPKPKKARVKADKPGGRSAKITSRRGRKKDAAVVAETVETDVVETDVVETDVVETDVVETEVTEADTEVVDTEDTAAAESDDESTPPTSSGETDADAESPLLDQRPTGKSRHRLRR